MTVRKILLAAGAAALMSTPAWANPPGNGPGDHPNANAQNGVNHSDNGNGHGKAGDHGKSGEHGKSHKCMPHNVGYVASGTLVSQTLKQDEGANTFSGTVEVEVTHTNHHASGDLKQTVKYEVSNVHVVIGGGVTDANSDGSVGVDDLVKGDRVHVLGKITAVAPKCTGTSFTATKTIRRIVFHGPAQTSDENKG